MVATPVIENRWYNMFEMDAFIRNMLINTASVLLPVILFQKIVAEGETSNNERAEKVWLTILGTLGLILCISYSLNPTEGIFIDLRPVLLLLIFYYGGFQVGGVALLITLAYRVYLGGVGLYIYMFVGAAICLFVFITRPRFRTSQITTKYILAGSFTFLFSIIATTYVHIQYSTDNLLFQNSLFMFIYFIASTLTMLVSIYLIESGYSQRKMRIELQRADNLHTVGRIAASMAHEIRNPLTVVRGFIQMMGRISDEEKRIYYSQVALQELDRAGEIINEYLSFAKPNHGQFESVNLTKTVAQTTDMIYSLAVSNGVQIVNELDETINIIADNKKLKQVLLNIMKNGIEAMKQGGVLSISMRKENGTVTIDIADTGIGMTREELKRLGTSFYSNKEQGTGLGLMVCFQLIKGMDGILEISSEPGKGSCFSIKLPLERKKIEKQDTVAAKVITY